MAVVEEVVLEVEVMKMKVHKMASASAGISVAEVGMTVIEEIQKLEMTSEMVEVSSSGEESSTIQEFHVAPSSDAIILHYKGAVEI